MSRRLRLYATVCAALVVGVFLAGGATAAAPPAPTISGPASPTNSTSASFTFSVAADPPATLQCRLDSGAFADCLTGSKNYAGPLTDGTHEFDVTAINPDGTSSSSYSWTIDSTPPPTPTITARPSNPSNDGSPTFRFSDNEGGVAFQCKIDTQSFANCPSPKTYTGRSDGNHTFSVRALDALQNTSGSASYSWTIDRKRPPAPTIKSGPANPTTSSSATFTFSNSQRRVTFQCRLDSDVGRGAYDGCTSPTTYTGLALGSYTFRVRAIDRAGNTGPAASYAWLVVQPPDTAAPQDVGGLRKSVGYKRLEIVWNRPADPDFDHVRVLIATARKGAKSVPRKAVYTGKGTHYRNKHFKSGQYYLYRILSYDHAGNQSRGVDVVVPPSVLLRAPRDGGTVHGPLRLVWAGIPKATFYNVQLYRNGTKILSRWPRASKLRLASHWRYSGHRFRLKKGKYQWFVWPGFGPPSKGLYGRVLGQATFTVR
jgi:hypothetical protein